MSPFEKFLRKATFSFDYFEIENLKLTDYERDVAKFILSKKDELKIHRAWNSLFSSTKGVELFEKKGFTGFLDYGIRAHFDCYFCLSLRVEVKQKAVYDTRLEEKISTDFKGFIRQFISHIIARDFKEKVQERIKWENGRKEEESRTKRRFYDEFRTVSKV